MKLKPSAFDSDELTLSLGDILRLLLGRPVKAGALVARLRWYWTE